jgi:two-component system, cell cycle sensor histidine kinase and response regulator CckA
MLANPCPGPGGGLKSTLPGADASDVTTESPTGPREGAAQAAPTRRRQIVPGRVGGWPIHTYFISLIVLFVLAAGAGALYVRAQTEHDARRSAEADARFAARTGARQLDTYLAEIRSSVAGLVANPLIGRTLKHPQGCTLAFSGVDGPDRGHLDIITADGTVSCSSRPHKPGARLSGYRGQAWLARAVEGPLLIGPVLDRATGVPVVISALPIPGGQGFVAGFVDLTTVGPKLADLYGGGKPVEFLVTSGDGRTVITRSIDPARSIGKSLRSTQFPSSTGGGRLRDLDGTSRFYARAAVPSAGWRFYAGEDASAALGSGGALAKRESAIIGVGLLAFLLATWFAYRSLVRPIRRLRRALSTGSEDARAAHVPVQGPLEIADLATDINELISAVDRELLERQRAEASVRASERDYRLLFENNPNPMWVFDVETLRFLAVNDAAVRNYGYSPEEFLGMTIEDIRPMEELAQLRAIVAPTDLSDRDALNPAGIWQHLRKDGSIVDVEVTSHTHEFDGRAARVVLALDVSERLRNEAAVRASELRYRELFENATDLIATTDLDGRITDANRAFTESLGYRLDELIGKPITELVPTEWHDDLSRARDEKSISNHEATVYEHELVAKSGRPIRVEVASRLISRDGQPIGVEAICRDISERKLLEERLGQSQRLEAVGQLAGGVAHDFNNLLTVISGYTQVLRKRPGNAELTELTQIGAAADRAAELTRQLLAFSRRQVLQPKVIDLNEIVSGLSPMLTRLIGEHVQLVASLGEELDPVLADPGQIEQVLMNLVINARDAMPEGGKLTIETASTMLDESYVESHRDATVGPHIVFAVSDTGTGMDDATLKRVFEPFFTTKAPGSGTGLGLATVHGIVKQTGGNIWVYSEPGHGTTFKIYLPAVKAKLTSRRTAEDESSPRGVESILVVEDQDAVRNVVALMLESNGYAVHAAAHPADALRLVEQEDTTVDLLLTDLVMPDMSGRELASQIQQHRPGTRVLYMSGYSNHATTRNGTREGGSPYLEKPFSEVQLARAIRAVLDGAPPVTERVASNAGETS